MIDTQSPPTCSTVLSEKAGYSRAAQRKLIETRTRLIGVFAKINNAIATGQIDATDRLMSARNAVQSNLEAVETKLESLRKSGDDWVAARDDVENCWEDLSKSVKTLVALFADGSTENDASR